MLKTKMRDCVPVGTSCRVILGRFWMTPLPPAEALSAAEGEESRILCDAQLQSNCQYAIRNGAVLLGYFANMFHVKHCSNRSVSSGERNTNVNWFRRTNHAAAEKWPHFLF